MRSKSRDSRLWFARFLMTLSWIRGARCVLRQELLSRATGLWLVRSGFLRHAFRSMCFRHKGVSLGGPPKWPPSPSCHSASSWSGVAVVQVCYSSPAERGRVSCSALALSRCSRAVSDPLSNKHGTRRKHHQVDDTVQSDSFLAGLFRWPKAHPCSRM